MLPRTVAFFMDAILIMGISTLLITKVILPEFYPEELNAFESFVTEKQADGHSLTDLQNDLTELDPAVNDMLVEIQGLYLLAFWIYFAGTEIFMHGGSLGKKALRIRVINARTLQPPGLIEISLRSAMKALCIQTLFPFLLVNFFLAFFTKFRQASHDLLAKTLVIDDREFLEPGTQEDEIDIEAEEIEDLDR